MSDPLRDQIEGMIRGQKASERSSGRASSDSSVGRLREDASALRRFFIQLAIAGHWMWVHLLRPIKNGVMAVAGSIFRQYRKLWSVVVYRRDTYGDLRLSKTRAGVFLTGTLVAAWCAIGIAGFVYDSFLYFATGYHDEEMYLTSSQEIDAYGNVHAVKGCSSLPCSDTDSVYFRINPSAFNHVWSFIHNRAPFYPDFVSAAVPPGFNRCVITSYGLRIKLLMRGLDLYPELLKASCVPVAGGDEEKAVQDAFNKSATPRKNPRHNPNG